MRARSLIVALAAIAGLTLGAVGLAGASDDTKCHLAIKGDSPTKAACDRGGLPCPLTARPLSARPLTARA